jgi:hypothetical protein
MTREIVRYNRTSENHDVNIQVSTREFFDRKKLEGRKSGTFRGLRETTERGRPR